MAISENRTIYKIMMVGAKSIETKLVGALRAFFETTHLPDGALHVTPDLTGGVVDELHADLQRHTSKTCCWMKYIQHIACTHTLYQHRGILNIQSTHMCIQAGESTPSITSAHMV